MAKAFAGKVIIITGSSSGIGRDSAILFAEQGANVTITGRNLDALEDVRKKMKDAGAADVLVIQGNVTDDETQRKLVEETVAKWGKLDVLVNNAGSLTPDNTKTLGFEQSIDDFDLTMDLNLRSVLKLSKLAMPHLIKTKGNIVNVSSIASTIVNPTFPYYCIAKAGMDHLTRNLAMTYINQDVRVNSVNPGMIRTALMNRQGYTDEQVAKFFDSTGKDRTKIPAGRVGDPREIGELIAFLANNDKAGYIVGQCIVVDGGRSMTRPAM